MISKSTPSDVIRGCELFFAGVKPERRSRADHAGLENRAPLPMTYPNH
jgi:hypothetical protein